MKGIYKLPGDQISPVLSAKKISTIKRSKSHLTSRFIIIFFLTFTICHSASAQIYPTFNMTVKNITHNFGTNGQDSIITFELYLQQTNQGQPAVYDFEYCCGQFTFRYNKLIHSPGGNLVFGIIPNASDLPPNLRPPSFQVDSANGYLKASGNLPQSLTNFFISGTYPGTRILTFKARTNNRTFNMVPLNLRFKLGPSPNTFVAFFAPYPDSVDSEQFPHQYAGALMDTVMNHYSVEDSSSNGNISLFIPPENFSTSGKYVNFSWQSVNAVSYKLQIATDISFNNIIHNDSNINFANSTVNGLLPGNIYYWRVYAKNDTGYFANSDLSFFNVTTAQTILVSPVNNQAMVPYPVTFLWRKGEQVTSAEPNFLRFEESADVFFNLPNNAESIFSNMNTGSNTTYKLEISTDQNFNNIIFNDSAITDSFKTVTDLNPNTNYYWRVTPESDSVFFAASQTWNFSTDDFLISPLNNSTNNPATINFIWHDLNAEKYLLQISTDSLLSNLIYSDSTITNTNEIVSVLNLSTRYYWKVSAKNDSGYFAFSQIKSFTTLDHLISPLNNSINHPSTVNFLWHNMKAVKYLLQVSTDPSMTNIVFNDSALTDTFRTVNGLYLSEIYYWRVSAKNDTAYYSVSPVWDFTTIEFLISPPNNSSNNPLTVNFLWHNVMAVKYLLQVSTDPLMTNIIFNDSAITDTFKTVSGLNDYGNYYWRVSAKNDTAYYSVSPVWNFTTNDFLIYPQNNSVTHIQPTFIWHNVNADSYLLQIWYDPYMLNLVYSNPSITDTFKYAGYFFPGTRYYWRVSARNGSGYFFVSPLWTFRTYDNAGPVEMSGFNSTVSKDKVILNWSTSAELNNSGFDVERSDVKGQTSDDWRKIGNITGNGTSTTGHDYSFTDKNLNSGRYKYRLKQIDFNGNFEYFYLSKEIEVGIPDKYFLSQNYPNPFNPSTTIDFELPADGKVSLVIYDISGKEIKKLTNEFITAGYYNFNFNATDLPSGIYFYMLSVNEFRMTKKMAVVK